MPYSDKDFLAKIKPFVIANMESSGILASLTASQAFIESNKGNSLLTVECNNLFGIKGKYNGQSGRYMTTEYYNGVKQRIKADFRKYPSWKESIADHSAMFNRMARYSNLIGLKDYKQACVNVKNDGYATSPTYTKTLTDCIEKYKLYEWDGNTVISDNPIKEYPILKLGSFGEYVIMLQTGLKGAGIYYGEIHGVFDQVTKNALIEWQGYRGLVKDGICGKKTWASFI